MLQTIVPSRNSPWQPTWNGSWAGWTDPPRAPGLLPTSDHDWRGQHRGESTRGMMVDMSARIGINGCKYHRPDDPAGLTVSSGFLKCQVAAGLQSAAGTIAVAWLNCCDGFSGRTRGAKPALEVGTRTGRGTRLHRCSSPLGANGSHVGTDWPACATPMSRIAAGIKLKSSGRQVSRLR